jgi:chemotaxis signal transduction protein
MAASAVDWSVPEHLTSVSLLVVRLGDRLFALPTEAVERILRMAALVALPGASNGVAGALNLHGVLLPVVDPRPRLGIDPVGISPGQRLIVVSAGDRYLLWVDGVEELFVAQANEIDGVELGAEGAITPSVARLDGLAMPVLSAEALDPGPIVRTVTEAPW